MAKQAINLSPAAVRLLNDILTSGKSAEITYHNGRLAIYEVPRKTRRYDVIIAQER